MNGVQFMLMHQGSDIMWKFQSITNQAKFTSLAKFSPPPPHSPDISLLLVPAEGLGAMQIEKSKS